MSARYNHCINKDISIAYVSTNKKLTLVAALGMTIGVSIYIFMSSLGEGFVRKSNAAIFTTTPHIRIYNDEHLSRPLLTERDSHALVLITNPRIVPQSSRILNLRKILGLLKGHPAVKIATPQTGVDVFYSRGSIQIAGHASGIEVYEADKMFSIGARVVEGEIQGLETLPNGIVLGVGIASKLNLKTGDHIRLISSRNVLKEMKVVGLFRSNNSSIDKTQSYVGIHTAQQLLAESASYVTGINVNIGDFENAADYTGKLSALTGYRAEDWKTANGTLVSGFRMRSILISAISMAILLVAGFGTYNILNMTISQKINEIAILKAVGFRGRDVVRIFVLQGTIIGLIGISAAIVISASLIYFTSKIYLGEDTGYFPIVFDVGIFVRGIVFGLAVTFLASYMPARKAANVDPVSIFRK